MSDKENAELVEMGMSQLALSRDPESVLREAKKAADVLRRVLNAKPRKLVLNKQTKEQYLEFEDWQLLGKFYGISTAVIIGSTRQIQVGGAIGFEAAAEAIHTATGMRVSSADAMCLNDEDNWKARPQYDYITVDGQQVKNQVGSKDVPMFQLRSMAQTRACAKALSNALRWVIVLSGQKGISGTPAEEMTGTTRDGEPAAAEQEIRIISAKFEKKCPVCGKQIKVGDKICYNATTKTGCHEACYKPPQATPAAAASPKADEKAAAANQPGDAQE